MKKIIYIFLFIPLMINLAACYDDMGNYDYTDLPDIDIKIQDTVYATQFKTLELTADVDLNDAPESDYEFNWRIWSNDIGGVWEQKEIGNSRNLTYEVAEVPGSYTLVLTVTNKKTEVQTYKQIYLAVQGSITEGWMVLQEREGKTDFDLIMSPYFSNRVENDEILHNVYETVNGEALTGRGVVIGSYFCIGRYQNVIVLTDKGGARPVGPSLCKKHLICPRWYLIYHPGNRKVTFFGNITGAREDLATMRSCRTVVFMNTVRSAARDLQLIPNRS